MAPEQKQVFPKALFFFIVAAIGLIVIDQTTFWSIGTKLIWPIGWCAFGLVFVLFRLSGANDKQPNKPSSKFAATLVSLVLLALALAFLVYMGGIAKRNCGF